MAKRDLRSFKKGKGLSREDVKAAAKKANVNIGDVNEDELHSMEETISKYENKSEGELMGDLEKMIRDGRRNGTFSDDMMEAFIKNVSPMMDGAQKKKLADIARKIKNKEI
jgi:hypothetical protein